VQFAYRGILIMLKYEHNAWVHMVATVFVCVAGALAGISISEWCWIVLAIVAVWTAEALNTALEFLADLAFPDFHPMVEKAKDVAAGAVLITCIGAIVIAGLVFVPHLMRYAK
jgi:diacylglycerol kinase (ATP)